MFECGQQTRSSQSSSLQMANVDLDKEIALIVYDCFANPQLEKNMLEDIYAALTMGGQTIDDSLMRIRSGSVLYHRNCRS